MTAAAVRLACTLPDRAGRSPARGDGREPARPLVVDGVVTAISAAPVRRRRDRLDPNPWRFHDRLTPEAPRDAACAAIGEELCDPYPRPLAAAEPVRSVAEKTSVRPRPRPHPTRPPRAKAPAPVEHADRRAGALNRVAASDTRRGRVYGQCHRRKRAAEFVAFLAFPDGQIGPAVTRVHPVLDNRRTHKTKAGQAGLAAPPRFVPPVTPVHGSWLTQVERWFGLLQRKRPRRADFVSRTDLDHERRQFIAEWNEHAHPCRWTIASFAKGLAGREEPAQPVSRVVPDAVPALPAAA